MRVHSWSTTGQMDVLGNGGMRGSFRQKLRQNQSQSEQVGEERGGKGGVTRQQALTVTDNCGNFS